MVSQFIMFHTLNWVDCSHKIYIREEEFQRNKFFRMFLNVSSLVFYIPLPSLQHFFITLVQPVEWHESRYPFVFKKRCKGSKLRTTQEGWFLVPTVPIVASNVGPFPPQKKHHLFFSDQNPGWLKKVVWNTTHTHMGMKCHKPWNFRIPEPELTTVFLGECQIYT